MECTVKHLENVSDTERETMVSKLYNMQWLKKTSPTCEKTKAVYKEMQDDDKSDIAMDKTLSMENIMTSLVEESVAYCSTDTCKNLSSDAVPENNANILIQNIEAANFSPNIHELVAEKDEEEEILSIVESIVTAKVEAQFYANKEQKDQSNTSQSNAENITRTDDCSNLSNSQKIDQDVIIDTVSTNEQNLAENSDDNNNHSISTAPIASEANDKQKSTCIITDAETCKASTEIKNKEVPMKKAINEPKTNFKNGCSVRRDVTSKGNEKSFTSNSDSKKPISNSLRSSRFIDKNERLDRFNNKTGFTKNIAYIKRQEFAKQQHNVCKSGTDKETKDVKSSIVKTDLKTESYKTSEACHSKNINKDKILRNQQQNGSRQFVSKLKKEEPFRRSRCQSIDKDKQLEKVTNASKNSDGLLNESEKKNGKTIDEKNFKGDQKTDCDVNLKRNTTFVMQYKNSTFSKSQQTKNTPKNTEQPLTDGKNSSYTRNQRFDRRRTDNAEHRAVMKKECTSTNKFSNSNVKNKEMYANNLENCSKRHEDVNRAQSSNVKSSNTNKLDTLASDDKNINSMKAETYLIGDKNVHSSVKLSTCTEPETMEQCLKEAKQTKETNETNVTNTIDKSKVNIDEQLTDMCNKMDKINPSKYSNLHSDKSIIESQPPNTLYTKSKNIQCMDDANQFESHPTIWYNNSLDNSLYKNAISVNSQQSIQNMPFNIQQTQVAQTGNQMRQMSQWQLDSDKFYDQHCPTSELMHVLQIPNTFDVLSPCGRKYECNAQTPLSCENTTLLETTMNGENPNLLYKCIPTVQPRSVAAPSHFPNHPTPSDQISQIPCRWNPSIQDGFYTEHPYNTTQLSTMNVYNPDDFNNCPQSVVYASPSCMQTWNPQLQYSTSGYFYNSPCANSYAILSNAPSQPNNFPDICSVQEQQYKYVPYVQMNEYARSTHGDPNNCARQTRNFADNIPSKSNQYYKNKNPDNYRTVYNSPQYVPRSRQPNMNSTIDLNQSTPCYSSNPKYYKQNLMQMSRKSQTIKISSSQDLVCDDGPEVVPPIISPKEFITSKINYSSKIDQFATRVFKPEFKARPNTNYHPLKLQKYNGGFQKSTTCQSFSKEYTPSVGRGTYKFKKV